MIESEKTWAYLHPMDINSRIARLEDWLRRIGDTLERPIWDGQDFVYKEVTPKHVAYVKGVRAVSSLHALPLLYEHGLLIDGGTIVRCINEALSEIYFVLENYPATTGTVEKFIEHFLAGSPPSKTKAREHIASRKVHSAEARTIDHGLNFNDALKSIRVVYETFSGYVHAQYPHVMEIYGGLRDDPKFNTGGVHSAKKLQLYTKVIDETIKSTELAIAFIAFKLGMKELFLDIVQSLDD